MTTNPPRNTVEVTVEFDDDIGNHLARTIALGSIDREDDSEDCGIFYYSQCETESELRAAYSEFGAEGWRIVPQTITPEEPRPMTTTTDRTTHTFAYIESRAVIVTTSTDLGRLIEQTARLFGSGAIPAEIIRGFVAGSGSPFFASDSMRFFNSRLIGEARIIPYRDSVGLGFVTSERDHLPPGKGAWNGERRYSRRVLIDAPDAPFGFRIQTVGDLGAFSTAAAAKRSQAEDAARVAWAF
jgi:hypothetical protein